VKIPIPIGDDEVPLAVLVEKSYEFVTWYLNCAPWKCKECGTTMFGRMPYCSYCKVRLGKETLRPSDFVEKERQ
jgi:hypothetical protein